MAYPSGNSYSDNRLNQTQKEVEEVMGVMREGMNKVLERDAKLSDLNDRADNLEQASVTFAVSSKKLKKKMWYENMKMKLIVGGILLAILIIIIAIVFLKTSGGGDGGNKAVEGHDVAVPEGADHHAEGHGANQR